jgi:hypothetical protein
MDVGKILNRYVYRYPDSGISRELGPSRKVGTREIAIRLLHMWHYSWQGLFGTSHDAA